LGDAWCRIAFSGQSEPLGYVLCLHLEQGHFTSRQSAHSEPVATQSHAQAPAISTTQNPTEAAAVNPTVLTNKDILDMHKIGLPPEILVAKIKSSQSNFDTSPSQLKQLKAAGLADAVILVMVQASVGQPQAPSTSADPPPAENAKPVPEVSPQVLNEGVLSPKEKYPLHVQVTQSNAHFVPTLEFDSSTLCYPLFGLRVCQTSGTVVPGQSGTATMTVRIEETGETTTVFCKVGRANFMFCQALPVGRYAARFRNDPHFLAIPALPLRGTKEVAAIFMKVRGEPGKHGTDLLHAMPAEFEKPKK
jgi:hypothetical protein